MMCSKCITTLQEHATFHQLYITFLHNVIFNFCILHLKSHVMFKLLQDQKVKFLDVDKPPRTHS